MDYKQFIDDYEQKIHDFFDKYGFVALNDKQFEAGLKKLDCTEKDLYKNPSQQSFYLKTKSNKLQEILNNHIKEFDKLIKNDEFLYSMFYYNMSNLEYMLCKDDLKLFYECDLVSKYYNEDDEDECKEFIKEITNYDNFKQIVRQYDKAYHNYKYDWLESNDKLFKELVEMMESKIDLYDNLYKFVNKKEEFTDIINYEFGCICDNLFDSKKSCIIYNKYKKAIQREMFILYQSNF